MTCSEECLSRAVQRSAPSVRVLVEIGAPDSTKMFHESDCLSVINIFGLFRGTIWRNPKAPLYRILSPLFAQNLHTLSEDIQTEGVLIKAASH